jgi:Ca2+-binding EF-hand superfamily protein
MFHKIEDATQRNNKLALMMRMIKQIDKDNNGYVTSTELDDILKIIFPEQLTNRNLKPIFKEFESI